MKFEEQGIKTTYELKGDRVKELQELVRNLEFAAVSTSPNSRVLIKGESDFINIFPLIGEITYLGVLDLDRYKYDVRFRTNFGENKSTSSYLSIKEKESGLCVFLGGDYKEVK